MMSQTSSINSSLAPSLDRISLAMGGPSSRLLVFRRRALIFSFSLLDADVVQISGTQDHREIASLLLADFLCMSCHLAGMPYSLEIGFEVSFHLDGHPD